MINADDLATQTSDEHPLADPALVQSCLAGDEDAWSILVDRYSRLVYSVARRVGLGDADADDVFQTVFITLVRRLHALRDQSRLSSWLITTTYRESWRVARGSMSTSDIEEIAPRLIDTSAPPAELIAQAERDQLVREALAQLDDRCRDLLTALFLDNSYQEIGQRLGMPVGSIGPTRTRCFRKLESLLIAAGLEELA